MASSKELQDQIRSFIMLGWNESSIISFISGKIEDKQLVEEAVERTCDEYPDYGLIQFFMNAKIVIDKNGEDDSIYMYNAFKKELKDIDRSCLKAILSPKLSWHHRRHTCEFVYNPVIPFKLRKVEGDWKFNSYIPPAWQEDYFYSEGKTKILKVDKLPEMYDIFIRHLVNNDEKSFEYIIDWLATMIQDRNYCFLTTIGNQGIGKGILGDIMNGIVGSQNFQKTSKSILTEKFNGQVLNKRLVYIDEATVTTVDQENRLKALVNDTIEVEKKGIDAKMAKNYASIYFSANNLDAVKVSSDDRRFSIVELTETKLIEVMKPDHISKLLDQENIDMLAKYLYHRVIDKKRMMEVFQSERTELVRSASLTLWQEWFLEDYVHEMRGKTVPIRQVSEDIKEACDMNRGPGRTKLTSFNSLYAHEFDIRNLLFEEKRQWCMVFKEEKV